MRPIPVVVAVVAFWVSGEIPGRAQLVDEKHAALLRKHGIEIIHFEDSAPVNLVNARIVSPDPSPAKVTELLRPFKKLKSLGLVLGPAGVTEGHLKIIKDLPTVTRLNIEAVQLSEQDMKKVATLQQLESLSLGSMEFTDAQLRPLQMMKRVKRIELECAEFSPTALAELRGALIQAESVEAFTMPRLAYFLPLKIAPDEMPLTKLKKEKVNEMVAGVQQFVNLIRAGAERYSSNNFIELVKNLKDSVLDLDDPVTKMAVVDGYVDLMKIAEAEVRSARDAGGGGLKPYQFHLVRYYYLDAQVLQLQLRKQLKKN